MADDFPESLATVKYHFTIDVEVTVDDLPTALLENPDDIPELDEFSPEQRRQYLELQRSLLYALVKRPEILAALVLSDAVDAASTYMESTWDSYETPRDHEILAPVIKTLPTYEQVELQAAIRRGVFSDLMEVALYEAIQAQVIQGEYEVSVGD